MKLISSTVLFLWCVLVAACGAPKADALDPGDPALTTKLGITVQEWHDVQQLASEKKNFVISGVRKIATDVLEVEFRKPDDHAKEQGGQIYRYEKKAGTWKQQQDFFGDWAVGKSPK
jgi:hypothetical protein